MFKLKKLNIILGIFILLLIGVATVSHAEEVTTEDMKNIDFEWITQTNGKHEDHNNLRIKVKNVSLIKDNTYYIHLSHNKDEKLSVTDRDSIDDEIWTTRIYGYGTEIFENSNEELVGSFNNLDNIVAENGNIYIWICELEKDTSTAKIVVEAKEINRINQLPLGGNRIDVSLDDIGTFFSCWETKGENERNVNVKIGIVSDNNILKAIKNKETNSMEELLTYAKSAKSIYNKTLSLTYSESLINDIDLVDGKYYYVYAKLDDENGKYFPIEDVILCQASVVNSAKTLYNYLDDGFSWNLSEEDTNKEPTKTPEEDKTQKSDDKETDNTTATNKLPYTGMPCIIISSVALIISTLIIAVKLKKYKGI